MLRSPVGGKLGEILPVHFWHTPSSIIHTAAYEHSLWRQLYNDDHDGDSASGWNDSNDYDDNSGDNDDDDKAGDDEYNAAAAAPGDDIWSGCPLAITPVVTTADSVIII